MVHGGDSDGLGDDGASAKGCERRDENELDLERKGRMRNQVNVFVSSRAANRIRPAGVDAKGTEAAASTSMEKTMR